MKKLGILIFLLLLTAGLFCADYLEYYKQGNYFEDIKDYQSAKAAYAEAIALEPHFAAAYNGLGFVYLEEKDYVLAKEYFQKALEIFPGYLLPVVNLGATYYREGNLAQAQEYFLKAIKIDPHNVQALTNLAVVKFKYRDYTGALDYYWQAKAADENYLRERYNKEKSLKELQAARRQDPENIYLKMLEEKIKSDELFLP